MTQLDLRCDYCGCPSSDRPLDSDVVLATLGMPDHTIHQGMWCSYGHYVRWCENYRIRNARDNDGNPLNIQIDDPGEMVISPRRL
jgi:hypothetical protein